MTGSSGTPAPTSTNSTPPLPIPSSPVILGVLQLGNSPEAGRRMAAAVPPAAVATALSFLRAHPGCPWLQAAAKYFPPLVDAVVAGEDTRGLLLVAPRRLLERVRRGRGAGGPMGLGGRWGA